MACTKVLKRTGKLLTGLAAGGMCLGPLRAEQPPAVVAPDHQAAASSGERLGVDKEVTLAPDGSFRVAVLTLSGKLVPQASITFTSQPKSPGPPFQAATGAAGLTVVSSIKPGLYLVRVEAPEGVYQGTLRVRMSTATQASFLPAPLVTLTLVPAHDPNQEPDCESDEDHAAAGPGRAAGLLRGRPLLSLSALAGGATAIALPLALSGAGRPARRASP